MKVSGRTVLEKMESEINNAKISMQHKEAFIQHIQHVKLLCELVLEEYNQEKSPEPPRIISNVDDYIKVDENEQKEKSNYHDGTSIFDF